MLNYGFVITKPLQFIVVLAVIKQVEEDINIHLLIVDNFSGSRDLAEKLKISLVANWSINFFTDEKEVFNFCEKAGYNKLFIDSDVGFRKNLTLTKFAFCSPKTMLAVYEEGVGSYRSNLYFGLKKKLLPLTGAAIYFGGSWLVKELYLFNPDRCRNKLQSKIVRINSSVQEILNDERDWLENLFPSEIFFDEIIEKSECSSDHCIIYLTNWSIDLEQIRSMSEDMGVLIVKPHPHIKEVDTTGWPEKINVAPAYVPAEIIINKAANMFKTVIVKHHASSVEIYLKTKNVSFIEIK